MKPICSDCRYNCTKAFGKDKQPIVMNKPKAICLCCVNGGRVVRTKLKKCEFYERCERQ